METIEIGIEGMSCGGCTASVTRVLEAVAGVQSATVTLNPGKAQIVFDATQTSREVLETSIEEAGYDINR
ncbi:heavy-metal-associated domain-containing protein [Chitinibacter bivalviorum]|uniref:Heavy-metal-associated domain-containing protein n=1 Tax=Chitinibacter bivalviorum TaxID=2739434 RepID=A0A7H9BHQ3_9NEIS|nr:heavy-metal-associated domain-containing protein [Chitinibacter bivalviorum]QLG87862.1 heavy-metal-associated domain-containing protein [Chitinibacter bivalviorum]